MTLALDDIPRILQLVKLYQRESNASRNYIKRSYDTEPIKRMRLPNYDEIEKFSLKLNLIQKNDDEINITKHGNDFLELFERDVLLAKKKIIQQCLEIKNIGQNIENAVSQFHHDGNKRWYPKWDVVNLFKDIEILPILYETGFLEKKDLYVMVNPEFKKLISLENKRKISLEQLEKTLEQQKRIGNIAEEIALNFEKDRLKNLGFEEEANKIKQISIDFSNAGYDIESFNGKTENGVPNRFIEVKGTTQKEFNFYWSSNEIKMAKKNGDSYWIYYISEIDVQNKTSPIEPKIFQDPFENIFSNSKYSKQIESYHIQEQPVVDKK
jgi:hypothetical protein